MENDLIFSLLTWMEGFPGGASGKELTCQCRRCRRHGLISGQENPLEEGMAAHPSIFAGGSHGQRSLVAYSPQLAIHHLDAQEPSLKKKNLK